jgi:hypothetical protein
MKRLIAGILWFFVAWYAWNLIASIAGLPTTVGPLLGLAAGVLFAVDPLGRIWAPRANAHAEGAAAVEPA